MDTNRLDELLARYDEAETTLAEERELKALLLGPGLPQQYHSRASYFGVQQVLAKAAPPSALPAPWKVAPEQQQPTDFSRLRRTRTSRAGSTRTLRRWMPALAAVLAITLVMTAGLLWRDGSTPVPPSAVATVETPSVDWSRFEVTDPEEATRITRLALAQVSKGMERGGELTSEHVSRIEPIQHAL